MTNFGTILQYIAATLSCLFSASVIIYSITSFYGVLPAIEQGLRPGLAAAFICAFSITPWFYGPGVNCSQVLNALIAAQITALLTVLFAHLNLDPLWPLTVFAIVLSLKLPPLHKLVTWVNLNWFGSRLVAGTALMGVAAQTMIAITHPHWPLMLISATFNTLLIGLNLQPYVNQSPIVGSNIIDHYFDMWKKLTKAPLVVPGLLMRCFMIALAVVLCNPTVAFAMPSPDIIADFDHNSACAEHSACHSDHNIPGQPVAQGAGYSSARQSAIRGMQQVAQPFKEHAIQAGFALAGTAVAGQCALQVMRSGGSVLADVITTGNVPDTPVHGWDLPIDPIAASEPVPSAWNNPEPAAIASTVQCTPSAAPEPAAVASNAQSTPCPTPPALGTSPIFRLRHYINFKKYLCWKP